MCYKYQQTYIFFSTCRPECDAGPQNLPAAAGWGRDQKGQDA